ncbi:dual specificity protein kinase splB isoform X2 [Chrysoperla carnea]|uniref:dual specificity protein kinase splB isoform X2 n=1 Tax=Chrysoperla carnea TaxID=189513 RepID=UPI001D0977E1|nr:dual specificity protein kinase splB isoform X2 [Chrysoperla carnea]
MRGQLLILTFGLAILFHGATSSRSENKNGTQAVFNKGRRLTKNEILEMAKTMGAVNYEEFSASLSSSASDEDYSKNGHLNNTSNESSNVSIRRQRAAGAIDRSLSNEQNYDDSNGVMGKPGRDFPVLTHIPKTKFSCRRLKSGYYADLDTDCQVFHICDNGRKISFLCPNGTIFRQNDQICDWWFKVECQNGASLISSASNEESSIERSSRRLAITKRPVESQQRDLSNINFNDSDELVSFEASTYQKPVPYQQIPSEQKSSYQNTNEQKTEYENRQSNQHSSSFQIFNQQFGSSTTNPTTQSTLRFTNSHHQSRTLFSTTTPLPQSENVNTPKPFIPKYQPISNIRNRTRTSKFVGDNNRKSNEAQVPAESASFTANSNKRYYQQGVINRQSSNSIIEQKSQTSSNSSKDFTRNNAFASNTSNNKTQSTSSNQSVNYSKSTRKYTRRPFGRYSSKVRQNVTTTTTPANNEFRFNESFALFTSTSAPLAQTTINSSVGGHFVTFTFPTQAPSRKQTPQRHVFSEPVVESTEPTTPYVTPKIDGLYSKVTKSYGEVQTTEITPELFRLNLNPETTTPFFAFPPLPANISDPTIFSPENTIDLFTTTEKPKYSPSVTKYSPTVPTITPKPSGRSLGTTPANVIQNDIAAENAIRMLHTLDEVVDEVDLDEPQGTPPRPGLKIPPSSSPDTLHSLAVYFASASNQDQQNVKSENTEETTETRADFDSSSLLTKSTLEQYNQLFTSSKASLKTESEENNDEQNILKEIDLDYQQSQGLVQSDHQNNIENVNATNIRKLARVFTHALSEYLKDPETFRKVLTEIRPKEPSENNVDSSVPTTTIFTDHPSITKEEGEVLDFSDVVKTTPRSNRYYQQSTEAPPTTTLDLLNPLAVQLNKEFQIYDSQNYGSRESNETSSDSIEEDYFPVNYDAKKETPSPYGKGLQPNNSKPLNANEYRDSSTTEEPFTSTVSLDARNKFFIPDDLNNLANIRVNDQLYSNGAKQLSKTENNDENLQIAFSQSFVNNRNNLERSAKNQNFQIIVTTTDLPTTTEQPSTTTISQAETTTYASESTSYYPYYDQYDSTTTQQTTTQEITEKLPENHWSNNPEISRFLQQTVTLDPNVINELITTSTGNSNDESTTVSQTTSEPTSTTVESTTVSGEIIQTTTEAKLNSGEEIVSLAESNDLRKGKSYSKTEDGVLTQQFVLNLPSEPMEKQMESAKMMFGSLNTTSQNIIMEKMKHADSNKSVRKLILLLISTCDLNHNRTLEHARQAILNALINVKLDDSDENNYEGSVAEDRMDNFEDLDTFATGEGETNFNFNPISSTTSTTTTQRPKNRFEVTTYKNVDFILPSRNAKKIEENSSHKNNVPTESPPTYHSSYTTTDRIDHNLDLLPEVESNSDKRALELLRSLYSLASRWARK